MQVYSDLSIITARPNTSDEVKAPHLGYGVLPANVACSAQRWLELTIPLIRQAWTENRLPILTGGTGLYIKTLMQGLSPIPDIPDEFRQQAMELYAQQGAEALKARDPEMAARLKEGDTQRHTRALEVMLATGKSLAYWQALPRERTFPDAEFILEQVTVERAELYRRCDARFDAMLQQGAINEVKHLAAQNLSPLLPAMRAVGVPELLCYLRGECSLEDAAIDAKQATRNYAKRQLTWFRNQLQSR